MGNMSYCRFQNTAQDLRDCIDAINNGAAEDLSQSEVDGLIDIIEMARELQGMFKHMELEDIIEAVKANY